MKERSYWADTVAAQPVAPTPLPARVDVLVVGGGITGLCAARALARRGATVTVLETHTIGWGASSRNGGMVLTGHKLGAATLRSRYGTEQARRLYRASIESVDLVAAIVRSEASTATFNARGTWRSPARRPTTIITAARRSCWRASSTTKSAWCRALGCTPRSAPAPISAASSMQ